MTVDIVWSNLSCGIESKHARTSNLTKYNFPPDAWWDLKSRILWKTLLKLIMEMPIFSGSYWRWYSMTACRSFNIPLIDRRLEDPRSSGLHKFITGRNESSLGIIRILQNPRFCQEERGLKADSIGSKNVSKIFFQDSLVILDHVEWQKYKLRFRNGTDSVT